MPENSLRLGIIGGALDSSVGRSHHIAVEMDGRFRIVTGAFSPKIENNLATARALDVTRVRTYSEWHKLLESECTNIDAVLILTPTPLHAEIVIASLKFNIPVITEKALCLSSKEACKIREVKNLHNGFLAVIYNYTGYPMVRELRYIIQSGRLGKLTHVTAEMPQEGFLRLVGNDEGKPQLQEWRLTDHTIPTVSLDLGVHLHQLILFLTGEMPVEVSAMEQSQGHFQEIIDNVQCLARYTNDLAVQMWFGKTALGHANGLRIRIYGTEGSAEWAQTNSEFLTISDNCGRVSINSRSSNDMKICLDKRYNRFKAGHPAGFIEALANYYHDIADSLENHLGIRKSISSQRIGGVEDALQGLVFLEAVSKSSKEKVWSSVILK